MKILIIIVFFLTAQTFFAQRDSLLLQTKKCPGSDNKQIILRGIIYDSLANEELPNATIYVKGTRTGTMSDAKGLFVLDITALLDSTKKLTIIGSYVGYAIKEIESKDNWIQGAYLSIPMVSNSGISCPGVEILVKRKRKK